MDTVCIESFSHTFVWCSNKDWAILNVHQKVANLKEVKYSYHWQSGQVLSDILLIYT